MDEWYPTRHIRDSSAVSAPDETDKTGETVSNDEFLHTLFVGLSGDAAPVVTSFVGNPATVSPADWKSRRWRDGDTALPAEANNYFSLATFRPDEAGEYRRRKAQFVALHVVMFDDIGGKVPMERVDSPACRADCRWHAHRARQWC